MLYALVPLLMSIPSLFLFLQLTGLGVPVTALEVHFKVNNLTQRYRQEQKTFETTGIISTWKFYSQVDDVFKSLAAHTGYK